jgi:hypothetical protein
MVIDYFYEPINRDFEKNFDYNWEGLLLIIILFFGLFIILNSNTVKKEFGIEVIHHDLDEVLDA